MFADHRKIYEIIVHLEIEEKEARLRMLQNSFDASTHIVDRFVAETGLMFGY
jgi:hypothetical protein